MHQLSGIFQVQGYRELLLIRFGGFSVVPGWNVNVIAGSVLKCLDKGSRADNASAVEIEEIAVYCNILNAADLVYTAIEIIHGIQLAVEV